MTWFDVVAENKIPPGQHHVFLVESKAIAVFNIKGMHYAIEDYCPHQGLPLSEGFVEGFDIECPFHGARFCLKTGKVKAPPACQNLNTFEVRIHNGIIQVNL